MDSSYREAAGHELEHRKEKEEAIRAKTLQLELQKKLGEDTPSTPQPPKQSSTVYQAPGSSPDQPAPYSKAEWSRMQKAYALGRERREDEEKAYEMRKEREREKERQRQGHIRAAKGVRGYGEGRKEEGGSGEENGRRRWWRL